MKTNKKTVTPKKKTAKGEKLKKAAPPQKNSSPVCYLNSQEIRDEYK